MSFMLLGILNSQAAGGGGSAYEHIASFTGTGSSITVSNIPQTYKHLVIHARVGTTGSTEMNITFNGSSTSNYTYLDNGHYESSEIYNHASAVAFGQIPVGNTGQDGSNHVSAYVLNIPDYAKTSSYPSMSGYYARPMNAGTEKRVGSFSMTYRQLVALTSITFVPFDHSFTNKTRFSIYGVTG